MHALQFLDVINMKDPTQKAHFYRSTLKDALPFIPRVSILSCCDGWWFYGCRNLVSSSRFCDVKFSQIQIRNHICQGKSLERSIFHLVRIFDYVVFLASSYLWYVFITRISRTFYISCINIPWNTGAGRWSLLTFPSFCFSKLNFLNFVYTEDYVE